MPYLALAVKLGSFLGQLAEGPMVEARLTYAGEIAGQRRRIGLVAGVAQCGERAGIALPAEPRSCAR